MTRNTLAALVGLWPVSQLSLSLVAPALQGPEQWILSFTPPGWKDSCISPQVPLNSPWVDLQHLFLKVATCWWLRSFYPPSQNPVRFMGLVHCVSPSPPIFWAAVFRAVSCNYSCFNWHFCPWCKSSYSRQTFTFECKEKRAPRATECIINVCELCKSEYFSSFWISNLYSTCMTLRFVSSLKTLLLVLSVYEHHITREDFVWNIWCCVIPLVSCELLKIESSPRKSVS